MKQFNSTVKLGSIILIDNGGDDKRLKIVLKILTPVTVYHNFDGTKTEQQDALVFDSTKVFIEPLFADMDTVISC